MKHAVSRSSSLMGAAAVFALAFARPASGQDTNTPAAHSAAGDRFLADVTWLADDAREGRGIGSQGLLDAAHWLNGQYRALGLEPAGDDAGFLQAFTVSLHGGQGHETAGDADAPKLSVEAYNVIGRLRAGAEHRLPGILVIGAHYDHLGLGGEGSLAPDEVAIHNGADDNASGTAALLEVARQLKQESERLRRDIVFVAFSGEERGLLGSSKFVHTPPADLDTEDIVAMLNMDMVGRLRDDRLSLLGGDSAAEWKELAAPLCKRRSLECSIGGDGFGASDQSSFYSAQIPVLHFFTGAHPEYHTPEDDSYLINADGGARVADLVSSIALAVANRATRLTYVASTAGRPTRRLAGGGARLGTIPDYAGSPDGRPGVLLSAVRPESPAEQGGLRRGDLIVRIDETPVENVEDFMTVLQSASPGQKAVVHVIRDGRPRDLHIVYGAPR